MKKPQWLVNLLLELKKAGEISQDHTGKLTLVINMSQGGITEADLTKTEKYK